MRVDPGRSSRRGNGAGTNIGLALPGALWHLAAVQGDAVGAVIVECRRCAFPNAYWKPRCDRCGGFLHTWRETLAVALILVSVPLVAVLALLGP
jgi:hypothetical protein